MKIEKVNENQIRCVLSHEDLEERQIKLSELAYGSEKAKDLFHEMVSEANERFGFNVDDIPLMVEAIPSSSDSLVLLISKVEYPDELDPRFSRFSDPGEEYFDRDEEDEDDLLSSKGAADIMELFRSMKEDAGAEHKEHETAGKTDKTHKTDLYEEAEDDEEDEDADLDTDDTDAVEDSGTEEDNRTEKKNVKSAENRGASREEKQDPDQDITCVYEFSELGQVEELACVLKSIYRGENSLYKDLQKNHYFLLLHKNPHTPKEFNKICNMAAEFGTEKNFVPAMAAYFEEHSRLIAAQKALEMLAML